MDKAEIILYQPDEKSTQLEVRIDDETVWLNQSQMVELFDSTKQNISLHINNIFKERELYTVSTVKEYLTVRVEGSRKTRRKIKHYNLDVIISVGYRVKSYRGTQFRIWANKVLKDYLLRGYAINQRVERIESNKSHDRFLIIDENKVYHIGASLKDLGEKWFAFSKIDLDAQGMINRLH
jgi:hypothetical protein